MLPPGPKSPVEIIVQLAFAVLLTIGVVECCRAGIVRCRRCCGVLRRRPFRRYLSVSAGSERRRRRRQKTPRHQRCATEDELTSYEIEQQLALGVIPLPVRYKIDRGGVNAV